MGAVYKEVYYKNIKGGLDMKRKLYSAFAAGVIVILSAVSVFGASDVTLRANGILQPVRNEIINRNGNILVGLREIADILGADDVYWDIHERNVTIKKNGKKVVLNVDSGKAFIDGEEAASNVYAEMADGTVMVPLRFISEAFDADVQWDEKARSISVDTKDKGRFLVLTTEEDIGQDTTVYTYEEALELAVKKSSSLKDLDESMDYLREMRDELGTNLRLLDHAYGEYMALDKAAANGTILSDSATLQLQISSTIDSTVRTMQGMKNADVNQELKSVNAEMIKDGVEATLKSYMNAIRSSQMQISLMTENVELGKENIENLELKYSLGMESEYNVNNAKLEQKKNEANLESLKIALDKQKQSLKTLLGVSADEDICVDYNISFDQLDDVKLESFIAYKKQNDPSIMALKAKEDIAKYNARISVNASDSERINYINTANTASRTLRDSQDAMEEKIRNAYNSAKQLEQQNKSNIAAVQEAVDAYNKVVVSYQAGMATIYQVNQAKMGILNAEIAVEQNALDYDMLVFTFERPYML